MECKFLTNGISIKYHDFIRPCCVWKADSKWVKDHNINEVNLITWHQHADIVSARSQLAQDIWPKNCVKCQQVENQGRQDSMRYNGLNAYQYYGDSDITLEIRPGNVCNFACQTCWASASTRVDTFHKQAGILDPDAHLEKNSIDNFDFLLPIADRLKSIILLGGEPFYDPNCLAFLHWCLEHTSAEITTFTNGSVLDLDLLKKFKKITLVFSLDAIGSAAKYIRFGTNWPVVLKNLQIAQSLPNVTVGVNITTSVYNFYYISDLIDLLLDNWPSNVTFGLATDAIYTEQVIPIELRTIIIDRLQKCYVKIAKAKIGHDQKSNGINAIKAIIANLNSVPYNRLAHEEFKLFVSKMDQVKKIKLQDHCPEISNLLVK